MGIPTREDLLRASDINETHEVPLPSLGFSVKVRALPAAYSNLAQSEATELVNTENAKGRIEQTVRIDHAKRDALKVLHGMVEPKLHSLEDAITFAQNVSVGTWQKVVDEIDRLSGLTEEEAQRVEAVFHGGGSGEKRPAAPDADPARNGGSAVPVRAGA